MGGQGLFSIGGVEGAGKGFLRGGGNIPKIAFVPTLGKFL